MDRRTVLALSGAALAGLAGCTSSSEEDPSTTSGPGSGGTTTDPGDGTTTDPGDGTTTEPPAESPELVNPSFEENWTGWTVGTFLPDDPNAETERDVAYEAGVSTWRATDGLASLRLVIDGLQDDGTVWVQQPVDLSDYQSISVDCRVSDSFNQIRNAAVYAGPTPEEPLTEQDFDTSQSLEGHDEKGWETFTYPVDHDGEGIVAVGFSVVWETRADAYLDNVVLSEDEPPTSTPTTTPPDGSDPTTTPPNGSDPTTSPPNGTTADGSEI